MAETSIVERRRCGINSQRRNVGPAGLDFILRLASHGLTAMAIESRAFGAAVDLIGMTTDESSILNTVA